MAEAKLQIAGDSDKAQQAIVALEKKIDKLEGKLKGVSKRTRESGRQAQQSFGSQASSAIASYAAQFVSLTAVIGAATQALRYHEQIKNQSAQKQLAASAGLAELAQLANTPQQLQSLINESREAFGQGIGATVDQAANLVFSLESAGIQGEDRQLFKDLGAANVVADPALFARSQKTLMDAMGTEETGSFTDISSKAFAASAASPSTADELLGAAAGSGGQASRLGISDEQVLAATAVLASPAGGAAEGGTQLQALLTVLEKKGGFEGLTIGQSVQRIDEMGLQGEELVKFFGRKEGLAAFSSLTKNMEQLAKVTKDVEQAQQDQVVRQKIELPETVPELGAALLRKQEESKLENVRVESGTIRNLREAALAQLVAEAEENYGPTGGFAVNFRDQLTKFNPLRTDRGFISDPDVQDVIRERDPELLNKILDVLQQIERKTEKPDRKIKRNE